MLSSLKIMVSLPRNCRRPENKTDLKFAPRCISISDGVGKCLPNKCGDEDKSEFHDLNSDKEWSCTK